MPAVDDRLFQSIVESANDAILATSVDGVIEAWNGGAQRMFGYSADEAIGTHCLRLVPRDLRRGALGLLRAVANGRTLDGIDAQRLARDGAVSDVSLNAAPILDAAGAVSGVGIIIRDITSVKDLENRLREMALRDPLTGLYNRRHFEAELDRELALARRNGHQGALFVLDLDEFKAVNDNYGHAAGDDMLCSVSGVLTQRLRGSDLIARIGGDEFAAILPDVDGVHALAIARSLEQRVGALRRGPEGSITTTASIGVAGYNGSVPVEATRLLADADAAMYARKRERIPG